MKIEDAHKHTDYYDFAHAGIDEQVVFRRTHEIGQEPAPGDLPFSPKLGVIVGGMGTSEDDFAPYCLGYVFVAGEVYPVALVDHHDAYDRGEYTTFGGWDDRHHRWDGHSVEFMDTVEYIYDSDEARARLEASPWFQKSRNSTKVRARIDFNDHFHDRRKEWPEWLARHGVVVGMIYPRGHGRDNDDREFYYRSDIGRWFNAPYLQRVGFQDVRNAFDVNQDIARYVSGVLPEMANPMVEISDADKVLKRNFDKKYGFRTRPEGAK